jgi:hypothetical protein
MSSGSSGQDPKYTSFDLNAVADGKRSNEWAVQTQHSSGNKKAKDAGSDTKAEKQSKKANSTGEKSASLFEVPVGNWSC